MRTYCSTHCEPTGALTANLPLLLLRTYRRTHCVPTVALTACLPCTQAAGYGVTSAFSDAQLRNITSSWQNGMTGAVSHAFSDAGDAVRTAVMHSTSTVSTGTVRAQHAHSRCVHSRHVCSQCTPARRSARLQRTTRPVPAPSGPVTSG